MLLFFSNFTTRYKPIKPTIMYHLTQTQAMFLVAFLVIIFLLKGAGKAASKPDIESLCRRYPEFKEPLRIGFPLLFCQEMKKRDMVYRDNWVPRHYKNDPNDPELRKMMKEKDLILTRDNQWTFTGKTKEYLMAHNAW